MSGSGSGRFKLFDNPEQLNKLDDDRVHDGQGRTEYDELGNAVWVPYKGLSGKEAMKRLLNDDKLAITADESKGTVKRIEENRGGLGKGYDPYDSGLLTKKQWKKKKDLRALSKWIGQKKKLEDDR